MGLTTKGTICAEMADRLMIAFATSKPSPTRLAARVLILSFLCHGGPIASPENAAVRARSTVAFTVFMVLLPWSGFPWSAITDQVRQSKPFGSNNG